MDANMMELPSTPGGTRLAWSPTEDAILLKAVAQYNGKNWKAVAANLPNRTRAQCAHRFQKVLNPNIKKGPWSAEEDEQLNNAVKKIGPGKWSRIAEAVPGRNGKQCRERWQNHLRGDVKKEPWSAEEDELIVRLRLEMGNRWAQIARHLPGRTENAVKNRWNAKLALEQKGGATPCSRMGTPRSASPATSIASLASESPVPIMRLPSDIESMRKRTSSLLSVLSRVSGESTATEAPPTPLSSSSFGQIAADDEEGPSRKKARSAITLLDLASIVPQSNEGALTPTTWKSRLEALTSTSRFSMGQFQKSDKATTPTATAMGGLAGVSAVPDLDWLASLAAARALTGLTAAATPTSSK